jgi:hypothetical protein
VTDPAGGVDAHVVERLDGARGQPVAADLLAGQPGLLQDDDVEAGAGEVPRGRGARRTGADDDHVVEVHRRCRRQADRAGELARRRGDEDLARGRDDDRQRLRAELGGPQQPLSVGLV